MTNKEAIKCLDELGMMADYNEVIKNLQTVHGMPMTIRLAIEAIEKQIPKKPQAFRGGWHSECGCGQFIEFPDKYCRFCGQAIDWSDDE